MAQKSMSVAQLLDIFSGLQKMLLSGEVPYSSVACSTAQKVLKNNQRNFAEYFVKMLARFDRFTLVDRYDTDLSNYTCVQAVQIQGKEFVPYFVDVKKDGEPHINGGELVKRAGDVGALAGLYHAEAMIREREKIPTELRQGDLVFPEMWTAFGKTYLWYIKWSADWGWRLFPGQLSVMSSFMSKIVGAKPVE